jgi:hypothetical protein
MQLARKSEIERTGLNETYRVHVVAVRVVFRNVGEQCLIP